MVILNNNFEERIKDNTVVALGNFDGIHLGHMELIKKAIELSKELKVKSMVYTFENHPLSVINKEMTPKLILSNESKNTILESLGIDIVNYAEFNNKIMNLPPEVFIEKLKYHFNIKGLVVGFNFRFGYKNLGDVNLLTDICKKEGIKLKVVDSISLENQVVSSSIIRNLISEGLLIKANQMLNYVFFLPGVVVHGNQIGRTINFPTINLDYHRNLLIPKGGVYFTAVRVNNKIYKGITNIGYNPTVLNKKFSIETFILNFDEDVYNKNVKIYFIERFRDEIKFDSLTKLAQQLSLDKDYVEEKTIENYNLF
ncbi:bifunctional riboflavin kinase/FAD synthetase [Clostridium grantii]|uniref:Riboflavin biosynthesis protein n=1 Tax=Clostridium grantii DSM 8605 TaxID=1121316 RepID=A0A1M5QWP2_9CLOT|nr:bifunctional riboflavin kinase/FAD synthetase [Clostridium grantii]SHH18574.1 riboflavin kinase / FMN adenylyltransferase [Clostridium grantii DSM 8605]